MSSYDVIGSGAGGGTLVHRLAPSGKRILLLERGDWLPREPHNWSAGDVFIDNPLHLAGHVVRGGDGQGVPAPGALLRWRCDQVVRRGALPPAEGGLQRAAPSRRHLPCLADRLRRDGAVLHASRAALPGARGARRGSDRAAGQRALSIPDGVPRAAHPAARRRPCRRRTTSVPRALRRAAERGGHGPRRLRPLPHLRRLSLPRPREVRRGGARGAAGARASQRHSAQERKGGGAPHQHDGHRRDRGRRRPRRLHGDLQRGHRRGVLWSGQLGQAAARLGHREAPERALEPVRPARRNYTFHNSQAVLALSKEENPTVFQKTLGLNDFYFGSDDYEYPLGNIQMVGKSQADMYRGEKPLETKLAPTRTLENMARHAVDFWLSTEDLPRPENRVTLDRDGNVRLSYTQTNQESAKRLYHKLKGLLAHAGMHADHLIPRHAYLKTEIPVAGVAHQAGTCRFGTDPETSVLNTDCRTHELDNLYVVDTSFFPSIGAVNPALTAMANALRVGDHLLERLGASSAAKEPAHAS